MDNQPTQSIPPAQVPPSVAPTATAPQPTHTATTSPDTHMILVILLLIFVYPVGLIAMWVLMKHWPTWLKLVITSPVILAIFGVLAAGALVAIDPLGNS